MVRAYEQSNPQGLYAEALPVVTTSVQNQRITYTAEGGGHWLLVNPDQHIGGNSEFE